jgi:hypothetical protein
MHSVVSNTFKKDLKQLPFATNYTIFSSSQSNIMVYEIEGTQDLAKICKDRRLLDFLVGSKKQKATNLVAFPDTSSQDLVGIEVDAKNTIEGSRLAHALEATMSTPPSQASADAAEAQNSLVATLDRQAAIAIYLAKASRTPRDKTSSALAPGGMDAVAAVA